MERIAHLSEQLGDRGEFFGALLSLSSSCFYSAELSRAGELAQRALILAGDFAGDLPPALAFAHELIGQVLQAQGELASSQKELEKALALAETETPVISFGHRAWFLTHLAQTLWLLGYPGQAFDRAEQARALAKNEPDLWSRAVDEWEALLVRLWLRDHRTVDDATRLLTFTTEHGLSFLIFIARICLGDALVQHGQPAQGFAEMELGLKEGVRMKMPWWPSDDAMLINAYAKVGRSSDATGRNGACEKPGNRLGYASRRVP
jgi:tetratricopeptide (TPR) repeat protein